MYSDPPFLFRMKNMARDDKYRSFADLASHERENVDFRVVVRPVPGCSVSVVAPHGGRIERHTSTIAQAIAGEDLNLYLFEGIKKRSGNRALHITSHRFDEPRCLNLISGSRVVVTIHGCKDRQHIVYVGGLDLDLKREFVRALQGAGIKVKDKGHRFPAASPTNICNRGSTGRGVQLEISASLRNSPKAKILAQAIRQVLHRGQHGA